MEIDSWGKVNLLYAVYSELHPYPWILLINEQGDILYCFWVGYHNGSEVKEVIIEDMNEDGPQDVEIVTYFGDPEEILKADLRNRKCCNESYLFTTITRKWKTKDDAYSKAGGEELGYYCNVESRVYKND